jgi:putative transcriptional regulator
MMTKNAFDKIAAGLKEAIEISQGRADPASYRVHVPSKVDVKTLRMSLGLTQEEFALRFNLSLARVRDWEQGRSTPDSAVRAYLKVIEREPKAVERALSAA